MVANEPKAIAFVLKDTLGLDKVRPWRLCWLIVCTVAWWKLLYCLWKALRCCIDCYLVHKMIGDYLGQHKDFPLSVMHAYDDSYEFCGTKFDKVVRVFLNVFHLPGEAHKIDRIMEKFSGR